MSKDSIRLSPKHGVNPSMSCCFWCGEPKEIILFGRLKGDVEAPNKVVRDYEPCDKCKAIFDKGIQVIGVSDTPPMNGMPPIQELSDGTKVYPSGAYFVVGEDYAYRIFEGDDEAIKKTLDTRKVLMPSEMVVDIISHSKQEDCNDEDNQGGVSDSDTSESD